MAKPTAATTTTAAKPADAPPPASTALEKQGTKAVVAFDFGEDAGAGFENQTADDTSVPFLNIIQSNSPIVNENEAARPGMLINTVTKEMYSGKTGVWFVPCYTRHVYTEFAPRNSGGGFKGMHELDSPIVLAALERNKREKGDFGDYYTEDNKGGNELIETFYVYGCIVDETSVLTMVVVAFTSTKIKIYKNWMTRCRTFQVPTPDGRKQSVPMFANLTVITTEFEKRPSGDSYNFRVASAVNNDLAASLMAPDDPRYLQAKAFKAMVEAGTAKIDYNKQDGGASGTGGGGKTETKLPF